MINLELGLGSVRAAGAGGRRKELQAMQALSLLPVGAPPSPAYELSQLQALPSVDNMSSLHLSSNILLDQQLGSPLPPGWEQCLDLKSGDIFYKNLSTGGTTHMDPRALAVEKNGDASNHFGASQSGTLIRTNIEAAGANQVYDHNRIEFVLGATTQQEKSYIQEELSLDVDLDLRLSSFLHVKHSLSSQSSSTSSHDSSMLLKSYSSLSCISDATMPGPPKNKVMSDVMRDDIYGSALQVMPVRQCSGSFSSSSSASAMSYQCQAPDDSDEDDTMNGDVDINRFAANEDVSMKMITAACARCLMFVLLSSTKEPMRCPLCGSHANPLKDL